MIFSSLAYGLRKQNVAKLSLHVVLEICLNPSISSHLYHKLGGSSSDLRLP